MKRLLFLSVATLSILSVLCGCTAATKKSSSSEMSVLSSESSVIVDNASYGTAVEGDPEIPENFLEDAILAYSYFEINFLESFADYPSSDNFHAYLVEDEQFRNYDSFYAYVRSFFSQAITDSLFSRGIYINENGYNYVVERSRTSDKIVLKVEKSAGEIVDGKLVFTVKVTFGKKPSLEVDREETFEFVARPENGKYVFTEFPYFY